MKQKQAWNVKVLESGAYIGHWFKLSEFICVLNFVFRCNIFISMQCFNFKNDFSLALIHAFLSSNLIIWSGYYNNFSLCLEFSCKFYYFKFYYYFIFIDFKQNWNVNFNQPEANNSYIKINFLRVSDLYTCYKIINNIDKCIIELNFIILLKSYCSRYSSIFLLDCHFPLHIHALFFVISNILLIFFILWLLLSIIYFSTLGVEN